MKKQSNSKRLKKTPSPVIRKLKKTRRRVVSHFPLLVALVGTFGVVAIFYGFKGLIDRVEVLANNPFVLLAVGILTLAITGTLYKKLG